MVGMDAAVVIAALAAASPPPSPEPVEPAPRPAPGSPARTVGGAIRRAHLTGEITWSERRRHEADLRAAKRAARRLGPMRSREVQGVLVVARDLAAQRRLSAERLAPVMAAIRATTWAMTTQPFPMPKERLQVTGGDGLVYEYRPRFGIQPHALASAGRLNALAAACLHDRKEASCRPVALARTADAVADVAVQQGDELRFEYVFPFAEGRAPFSSSMSQATTAQALARAGRVTGARSHLRAASAAYRALISDATAVRSGGQVVRFKMYSFAPRMRVLNGELQTLVGLADYARVSGNRSARRIVRRAARNLAAELPAWDTGAWTLYNTGGREATLNYHTLAAQFAGRACDQRLARGFCPAARRYARYTREPPRMTVRVDHRIYSPRRLTVQVRSSKLASGALVVRGPKGFRVRRPLELGRRYVTLRLPFRRAGRYRLVLSGTAVNKKLGATTTYVRATRNPEIERRRKARKRAADRRRRAAARARARERREARDRREARERRERRERERRKREREAAEQQAATRADGADRPPA